MSGSEVEHCLSYFDVIIVIIVDIDGIDNGGGHSVHFDENLKILRRLWRWD